MIIHIKCDPLDKDYFHEDYFKAEPADMVLGIDISLGGDPRISSERMGEGRLWRRKASKGCVVEVTAVHYHGQLHWDI